MNLLLINKYLHIKCETLSLELLRVIKQLCSTGYTCCVQLVTLVVYISAQ